MDYLDVNDQELDTETMRNILEIESLEIALDFQKLNVIFKSLEDLITPPSTDRGIQERQHHRQRHTHSHSTPRSSVSGVSKRKKSSRVSGKSHFMRRFGVWVRKLDKEISSALLNFPIPQKMKKNVKRTTNLVKIDKLLEELHEIMTKPKDTTTTRDKPQEEPARVDCPQNDVKKLSKVSKKSKKSKK